MTTTSTSYPTTYLPFEELKKIPKHIWANMPEWKASGMAHVHDYANFGLHNKELSSTFDSVAKRKFKTEETYNYVKDNAHKFSIPYMKVGDCFKFEPERNQNYYQPLIATRVKPINSGPNQIRIVAKTHASWEFNYYLKDLAKLWNRLRSEAKEESLPEKTLLKREVKVTNALIHIASNTIKLSNEIEALREKINNGTLTQNDLSDMWFRFDRFNHDNKQWKSKLPKRKVSDEK